MRCLGSWQPWQTRVSPGWKCVPERIDCTASPCSSRAWKKTSLPAGSTKCALPSASTGTVPSTARPVLTEPVPGTWTPLLRAAGATDSGRICHTRSAVIFVPAGQGFRLS